MKSERTQIAWIVAVGMFCISLLLLAYLYGGAPVNVYQVTVQEGTPVMQQLPSASSAAAAGKPTPSEKVNLNLATEEELTVLPGVGEALAHRIVAYREENGSFDEVEELLEVTGIGEKKFEGLREFLVVE